MRKNPERIEKTEQQYIDPRNVLEVAFQSYEKFSNNALEQQDAFIADEIKNPHLQYNELLSTDSLDEGMARLFFAKGKLSEIMDNRRSYEATAHSLDFRVAEMEYVKLAAKLQALTSDSNPNTKAISEATEQMRALGIELYGEPDPEIRDMALNELWSMLDGKNYHESAQVLYDELVNGVDGVALMRAEDSDARLPRYDNNEALDWARDRIIEKNYDIKALVYEYWNLKVAEQPDGKYECTPEDFVEVVNKVINTRDPENTSGISAKIKENAASLSWDTKTMSVQAGADRSPLETPNDLFCKILHEFGVHGQRAVNGLKTDLPILGMGLYTNTPRQDYLTFEEGLATTIEAMAGKDMPEWTAVKLGHYVNIAMAQGGADFRHTYEVAWRYRLLSKLGDQQEVTDEMLDTEKKAAYKACVRIFRGTQPDSADRFGIPNQPLTYNKDLAYLNGRVLAMRHLEDLYERQDDEGIDYLFKGKFDPTNPVQDALAGEAKVIA